MAEVGHEVAEVAEAVAGQAVGVVLAVAVGILLREGLGHVIELLPGRGLGDAELLGPVLAVVDALALADVDRRIEGVGLGDQVLLAVLVDHGLGDMARDLIGDTRVVADDLVGQVAEVLGVDELLKGVEVVERLGVDDIGQAAGHGIEQHLLDVALVADVLEGNAELVLDELGHLVLGGIELVDAGGGHANDDGLARLLGQRGLGQVVAAGARRIRLAGVAAVAGVARVTALAGGGRLALRLRRRLGGRRRRAFTGGRRRVAALRVARRWRALAARRLLFEATARQQQRRRYGEGQASPDSFHGRSS